jgi:mannose-6-phosphate isomerase class I
MNADDAGTPRVATTALPLMPTRALPVLAPTRVEVTTPAGTIGDPGTTWRFLIAVVDESNAPGLTVRPLAQLDPDDPLAGHELWYPLTDTVVVAGLRETGAATRLLQLLSVGSLNRILMRMITPVTRSTGAAETLGTVCGLSTLACWPDKQRAELVSEVAGAAVVALEGLPEEGRSGGTAMALRWVRDLARAYPSDPLVLAPLLLQLRTIRPGKTYVIPPGWAFAHLRGTAIRIVAADTPVLGGGLGAKGVDRDTFADALTAGHAGPPAEPLEEALAQATELAERVAAQHPLAPAPRL